MGNCCSSKKEENEFDDDLNTLKPGDGRMDLQKGNSVDLDDLLGEGDGQANEGNCEKGCCPSNQPAKQRRDPTYNMTAEQKEEYLAQQKQLMERKEKLDGEFDDFIKNKMDPDGDHLDADKKLIEYEYFYSMV